MPYANFGDPQILNLYTYLENSPLNRIDAEGHEGSGYGSSRETCNPSDCTAANGGAMNLWLRRKETMKAILQVLVGLVFCVAVGVVLIYSSLPIFWEHEERLQFHVYPITWRSGLLTVLLLAVMQAISFLVFRCSDGAIPEVRTHIWAIYSSLSGIKPV